MVIDGRCAPGFAALKGDGGSAGIEGNGGIAAEGWGGLSVEEKEGI